MRLLWVSVVLFLVLLPDAHAAWSPGRPLAPGDTVRAAVALGDERLLLWAGSGQRVDRYSWDARAQRPSSSRARTPFEVELYEEWRSNARGDVLMVGTSQTRRARALLISANGDRIAVDDPLPAGRVVNAYASAVGDDGTAVVAWLAESRDGVRADSRVWVRVRRDGDQFGPAVVVRGDSPAVQIDAGVRPDGTVEVLYADSRVRHLEANANTGLWSPVRTVADAEAAVPFLMRLSPGGVGVGRVFLTTDEADPPASGRMTALMRTSETTWGLSERFERHSATLFPAITSVPGGGTAIAYDRRTDVVVRRAAPNAQFGAGERIASAPKHWYPGFLSLASNTSGELLVTWDETLEFASDDFSAQCGDDECAGRIVASLAGSEAPFEAPRVLTPLGTVLGDRFPTTAAALSPQGRRLVAWTTGKTSAAAPSALWASLGVAGDDVRPSTDTTAPRLDLKVSRRSLRTAVTSGRLRVRLRCSEECAVRVWLYDLDREEGIRPLRAIRLVGSRPRTVTWSISGQDRRMIGRALTRGRPFLTGVTYDDSGNARPYRVRPR